MKQRLLTILAIFQTGLLLAEVPELVSPWEQASSFLVGDAYRAFEKAEGMDPLERKFGTAVTLMNLQPRTQGNLQRSMRLFNEIAEEAPPGEPLNALARFFRARIQEFYIAEPENEAAAMEYMLLLKERTGSPVVELAASTLVSMAAFSERSPEQRLSDVQSLESLAEFLETPTGKREYHTTMAYALLDVGGDPGRAVEHFRMADEIGWTRKATSAISWIAAGEAAVRAGRPEDAAFFFRRMVEEYPRDPRTHTVRQRLKELESHDG